MKSLIVPAVITKSQKELDEMLEKVRGKVERVMLDVMDGKFVPNSSLEFDFQVPKGDFEYEAHLMTLNQMGWIEENAGKVDIVVMQVEALEDIGEAIALARSKGLNVTLALNPETKLDVILPYLDQIDAVLILTVNPGSFCVEFLPETLEKITQLRKIDANIPIEVDGCMNPINARVAKDAGATIFASGSFVIKSSDPAGAIKELKDAVM
jgi:ribulose-phosphate 3-epimerase